MTDDTKHKFPVPDPFGILEDMTDGTFFDPIAHSLARASGPPRPSPTPVDTTLVPPDLIPEDMKVTRYIDLLKEAHRIAPCKGCKGLVESALTGAMVYRKMQESGLSADDIKKEPGTLEMIKKQVQDLVRQG